MRITSLTGIRGGRTGLHLDGEFCLVLHSGAAAGLQPGQELDPKRLEELTESSGRLMAKERALRMLSRRLYTCQGLYERLEREYGEKAAQAAVERMLELGLLDDGDYARRLVRDCLERRGFSPERAARELSSRGVSQDVIGQALAGQAENPEAAIARVVKKKYLRALGDEKGLRRTYNALARLGYGYGDIRAVLERLREDENYYDE